MKIYNIKLGTSLNIPNINLAIGNFDGIHLGHQKIIKELINSSVENQARPAILSFKPHPRQFFSGNYNNFNIITENSKISLLEKLGIEYYFSLEFDSSIASLTAEKFIKDILIKQLNIKNLIVGYNFRFGKDRLGDVNLLKDKSKSNDFGVKVINPIKYNSTREVFSSSLIRKNIQDGNFGKVNIWLERKWSMSGTVILGDKRAGKINFPTANLIPPSDLIHPKKGVYAVKIKNGNNLYDGVANFGNRPTVDGTKLLLEAHLFEFNQDIYGNDLTVEFLTFIRDEKKFGNFALLTEQIHKDIQIAKDYHSKN